MVAGPNGSGKSSLYGNTDIEAFDQSVWIINPDLLTQRIQDVEKLPLVEANVRWSSFPGTWTKPTKRRSSTIPARYRNSSGESSGV
jgi:hypothetical protein